MQMDDVQFSALVDRAFDSLPPTHRGAVKNVAIVIADEPTEEQRIELALHCNQTLLGLYTGVPLPQRQGRMDLPPDVITIFKLPLLAMSANEKQLYEEVRHTLWHEVAHYFGLNHDRIHELEQA